LLRKTIFVVVFAALAAAVFVGWQIGSCELANYELQDDLKDLTAQVSAKVGLVPAKSETEIRDIVIQRAAQYGIELLPYQVTVGRYGAAEAPEIRIRVEYDATVSLSVYSLVIHFTPEVTNQH
jgi:hypothetical protein